MRNKPTKPVDAGTLPEEIQQVGMTLIAHMLNTRSMVFNMDLTRLSYDGNDLGDWEISVRRTRDP